MASTQIRHNENLSSSNTRLVAFFRKKDDAYRAISDLRDAGFTNDQIGYMESQQQQGVMESDYGSRGNESVWQKIKDFFTGDSHDYADYDQSTEGMGWDQNRADYYYRGINEGGALVSVSGPRRDEAREILQSAGGDLRESGFESSRGFGTGSTTDEKRIQLRGEILQAYKERVQRGEVRLRKEVITDNQTISVPVTREELVIERTAGSGQRASGEIGSDEEIRVPLSEERARVEKQPVVNEEVRVGKRAVQNTQQVSGDVRHEELKVENEGNVDVNTDVAKTGKRKKPAA